jgi:hypothetical protein
MRSFLLCGCLLLAAVGCGRPVKLAPVSGRVSYRGRPLAGGTIVFTPDPERGGRGPQAWAEIDSEGRYRLCTAGEPGAVPGWHRITVAPPHPRPEGAAAPPPHYRDPDLSGQRFEVKPDQPNTFDLPLE